MSLISNMLAKMVSHELPEHIYYKEEQWGEWIKLTKAIRSPEEDLGYYCTWVKNMNHSFRFEENRYIRKAELDNSAVPCSKEEWENVLKEGAEKILKTQ